MHVIDELERELPIHLYTLFLGHFIVYDIILPSERKSLGVIFMGFAQMMEVFEKLPEETRKAFVMLIEEFEKRFNLMEKMATKDEMNSLKEIVAELAEAQKRTEERLTELAQRVDELAEAQKRTEERLNELAEAQKRTEERLNELAQRVDELAEAQRRTEERLNELAQRVDELAEAQKRTEERLNELAEAQRRTEETLNALLKRQKIYERKADGLSHSFGFLLEDRAIQSLPEVLGREGIKAIGRLSLIRNTI